MRKVILTFVICVLMVNLCGCAQRESVKIDADVLTISSKILEGELIGHFLGSSDGWLRSDVIKVGIKFEIDDELFLEDLKLSHAQLAYYKDRNTLPIKATIISDINGARIKIRLDGYYMKSRRINYKLAEKLINYLEEVK